MSDDEDREGRLRRTLDEELARKEEELRVLEELRADVGFAPRRSLARTPPQGFSSPVVSAIMSSPPYGTPMGLTAKRPLASPEEQPIPTRRRVGRGDDLPPVSGIMSDAPAAATKSSVPDTDMGAPGVVRAGASTLSAETAEGLTTIATNATRGIMDAVRSRTSKLNKEEIASIGGHTERLSAVIAHMAVRLAAAEAKIAMGAAQGALAQTPSPPSVAARSYAGALKMPNGKPPMPVQHQGPAVIFYPTAAEVKTSEETKRILQEAVKPSEVGIRVTQVRKVGNSGVVVRTATAEAAAKLRSAVPAGLRAVEPKSRLPRVALRYLRSDVSGDTIVEELHRINLAEDAAWPLARFKQECKLAVKKQLGPKFLVVLECSKAARDLLIGLGRVYVGWDEADVCDHIRATCCSKCQQYGHPEKYCRSKEVTCGKCGETGHRSAECKAQTQCCATCKRFKRSDAGTHATAAASCPARRHAEQQAVNMIQYG